MNITKELIAKEISTSIEIKQADGLDIVNSLVKIIKNNSKKSIVKIAGFGSFQYKLSPKRIGRDPISKKSYIIEKRNKLNFKASGKVREKLN